MSDFVFSRPEPRPTETPGQVVWNWRPVDRYSYARAFRDDRVVVWYSARRDATNLRVIRGRVVSVAEVVTGAVGGSATIVVRDLVGDDYAISLATVHSIGRPS